MKTGMVSALHQIVNGFAASYATAAPTSRGSSGNEQQNATARPMGRSAISSEPVDSPASPGEVSHERDEAKLNVVA